MNTIVKVSVQVPVFNYFGTTPRNRISESYGNSKFNFSEEPPYCFPQQLHHFIFQSSMHKGSSLGILLYIKVLKFHVCEDLFLSRLFWFIGHFYSPLSMPFCLSDHTSIFNLCSLCMWYIPSLYPFASVVEAVPCLFLLNIHLESVCQIP